MSRLPVAARSSEQSGWLGRAADRAVGPGDPTVPAVFVGTRKTALHLNAERAVVPSLRGLDDWILQQPPLVPAGPPSQALCPTAPAILSPRPSVGYDRTGEGQGVRACSISSRSASAAANRTSGRIEVARPRAIGVHGGRVSAVSTGGHAPHDSPTDPCRSGDSHFLHRVGRTAAGRLRQPCRSAR